jgi:hypothetical protein
MRLPDLRPTLPPQPDDIHELRIRSEKLCEFLHIVPIPRVGKRIDDVSDF